MAGLNLSAITLRSIPAFMVRTKAGMERATACGRRVMTDENGKQRNELTLGKTHQNRLKLPANNRTRLERAS